MTEQEYAEVLVEFIGNEFLQGEQRAELDQDSPLMESGTLDSLRVALLLSYIRDELHLYVSPAKIDAHHFKDIRTVAGMLHELSVEAQLEEKSA
ncbi:acyl carrier protein [Streptomyces antarcticus]|uniref:acyl carrier protein n=1 Tax=Streptomyces antarcticus TaxID=2996458 RepID=UPI00226E295C|nr:MULTISPECIES: acyl carrier protein [unclassified Streptomyces]MCY0941362.1 acyl carrier protein [Streptomyces sp. H34-AA3]MCZ4086078.1 acyl carrier protein [Streptomyces sp. H34-S5]